MWHPDIVPGGTLENLCHPYSIAEAINILNTCDEAPVDGHPDFPISGSWRFWDRNGNGVRDNGESITLRFYVDESDYRMGAFGVWFCSQLENEMNIDVDLIPTEFTIGPIARSPYEESKGVAYKPYFYMAYVSKHEARDFKNFHLCLDYWDLGSTPEHLAIFHSSNYWHPDECPNYGAFNCTLYDTYAKDLASATTPAAAQNAAMNAQRVFADPAYGGIGFIPIATYCEPKAYQRRYNANDYWRGIVNMPLAGPDNWWSFLNMYPENHPVGDGSTTMWWGYLGYCARLNPLSPYTSLDCEVLNLVYDSLLRQNPYTGEWVPWLCENFQVGTWIHPNTHEELSKIRFTLRDDVYWHDGQPVTIADVAYTLFELPDELWKAGFPMPFWSGNLLDVIGVCILDPLNIEILFDTKSVWAPFWIGSNIILPKHIWKPMVDSYLSNGQPNIYGFSPDPNLIGTGPWRFKEYVSEVRVVLEANKPGRVVNGITSPGYWQLQPVHANITAANLRVRFDPVFPNTVTTVDFTLNLHNLWLNQSSDGTLTVSKYVYLDNTLIAEEHGIQLHSSNPVQEHFQLSLSKCKHEIKIAVRIDDPPWLNQWTNVTLPIWITIKQDIGGALYQNAVPAPDCKVDGKDTAFASSAYNTVPGDERWNSIADVTGNYKVDGIDIANINKYFGKW